MRYLKIDVRKSTCQGGGALWSLLSHVRDLPAGDSIELLTDDSWLKAISLPGYRSAIGESRVVSGLVTPVS